MKLVIFLVGGVESIHPRQPRLLAVVRVEDDGDIVQGSDLAHVLGGRNGSGNGGLVGSVVGRLSGNELTSSLGESYHDGSAVLLRGFHAGIDRVSSDDVDSGDCESDLLGVVQKINQRLSGHDTRLNGSGELGESLGGYKGEKNILLGPLRLGPSVFDVLPWFRWCSFSKKKQGG